MYTTKLTQEVHRHDFQSTNNANQAGGGPANGTGAEEVTGSVPHNCAKYITIYNETSHIVTN
jgi:hypothetical protein